jgi:cysteine desulfurase/selenocysteine lyase
MTISEQTIVGEFPLTEGLVYLNHAAVSPWPLRTSNAIKQFADENTAQGSLNYPRWLQIEAELRQQCRQLINAPSVEDIALLKNTSEALSVVAYGLNWRAGDNIVITDQEFPSNRIVWQSLQRYGVQVRVANLDMQAENPEQALIQCCDNRTRLLAISSIQYATGFRADLEALGNHCRMNDILFCVDAIQSIGAVNIDVQAIKADFVMADGHKWMLAPEGLALFYCSSRVRKQLTLRQYGWHMTEDYLNFNRTDWQPATSGRRFECGSPNMLGVHGLHASLSLLLEVGMDEVESRILQRAEMIMQTVEDSPRLELVTPRHPGRYGGIVTFRHRDIDAETCLARLTQQQISCAARGGAIRFAAHFYTPPDAIAQALEYVNQL